MPDNRNSSHAESEIIERAPPACQYARAELVSEETTMKYLIAVLVSSLGLALATSSADAQSVAQDRYPSKPVRIILPFAPGGTTDIVARALADELKRNLGQPIIIENKPGADGIIAIQELVRSGADGYAFMLGNVGTNAIAPILYADKMSLNYERDVVAVMRLVDVPHVMLATTRDFPPRTVAELIDYAKKNPGNVNYGTPGAGNYTHYDMALFAKRAGGLKLAAIPNKAGASGVMNDLLVGTVQVAFLNAATPAGNIQAGNLRALALVNHARLPSLPNVPTMQEVGFPEVGTIAWQGLFAAAATPREVLEKVRSATARALQAPAAKQTLEQQAFNIVPTNSLDEAKSWFAAEMSGWRKVTQEVKIEPSN
jgi:tripartite-type tricarboxylate transporter receptor subunit TctC